MSDRTVELNLLVMSEADLASGLALAVRVARRGGFRAGVTVVSDSPASLVEQVKGRLKSMAIDDSELFQSVVDVGVEQLDGHLNQQSALRVLLVPGVDRMNDLRRGLMRRKQHVVICFEPHGGLESSPENLWVVSDEEGDRPAHWFAELLQAAPELSVSTIDELAAAYQSKEHLATDWVLVSCREGQLESSIKTSKAAVEAAVGPVLLVQGEASWNHWFFQQYLPAIAADYIPQMDREKRRELAETLAQFARLDFEFIALICASTFLASFGLIQNSAAVIIGAMLVAPLMTPILGTGLALAHGNRPLFRRSLTTIVVGFFAALLTSAFFGVLVRFLAPSVLNHDADGNAILTSEMWARTHPSSLDLLVGLVGGSAAAFARTRSHLADALAGAAIAAALVPPIATAGLQLSLIRHGIAPQDGTTEVSHLVYGPIILFVANMLTIMIGSSFVLWACGLRSDHTHSTRDRWATRMTMFLMTLTVVMLVWIIEYL